jgi:hypothetical protein
MATKGLPKRKRSSRTTRRKTNRRRTHRRRCIRRGGSLKPSYATTKEYDGVPLKNGGLVTSSAGADSFTGTFNQMRAHKEYMDFQGGVGDGTD